MKNYSQSCERNKEPILAVLQEELSAATTLLEIGSGSGQHALFFAEQLPHLQWQPSERPALFEDLKFNTAGSMLTNLQSPLSIDVNQCPWPVLPVETIFTANTLHIMDLAAVENFFRGVGATLLPGGKLCVYGPFRYHGEFTSVSNSDFDRLIKKKDKLSGIRDFEKVDQWAGGNGLQLLNDHQMPSNNQLLVWRKVPLIGR